MHEGRRCRWTVWGQTYEGVIKRTIHEPGLSYWTVLVDGYGYANVIVDESKLLPLENEHEGFPRS